MALLLVSKGDAMNTVFFLVKFFDKPEHANAFVCGRVFARRLSAFKKDEDSDESGRMDRHEGTISWMQPGKCQIKINGMDISADLAGPAQVQRHWLNHINVFCVHAAHSGDLDLASLSNIEGSPETGVGGLRRFRKATDRAPAALGSRSARTVNRGRQPASRVLRCALALPGDCRG